MNVPTKLSIALSLLAIAGLAGCGNDDDAPRGASGKLTQGPVSGAAIYADNVSGGVRFAQENGEVSTTTDANGRFTLPSVPGYNHILVSTGGTDTLTGKAAIRMIAPSGAANVTPLTTLVALDASGLLKAKILALGAAYDTDISLNATPALLNLSKSVEMVVASLTAAITANATTASVTVSPAQHAAVQLQAMQSIAATFSATAQDLSKPASLNTAMTTAVSAAIVNINDRNSNIPIPGSQATAIATNSVTAATTAVLGASMVGSTTSAAVTGVTVESSVITPAAITALNSAITSNVTAVGTFTVIATPAGYVAPSIPVTTVITVAPTGSTGGAGGSGSF